MSEEIQKKYPYLGRNFVNEKAYIVFFTEPDTGVVVLNDTDSKRIKFGMIGSFDESRFEVLPHEVCVRLQN